MVSAGLPLRALPTTSARWRGALPELLGMDRGAQGAPRWMEDRVGVEPTTRRLRVNCSTTELPVHSDWLRGPDLNRRPPGYEPDELPDCSTARDGSPAGLPSDGVKDLVRMDVGAGTGNRTRVFSLEGCGSTIELHPRGCGSRPRREPAGIPMSKWRTVWGSNPGQPGIKSSVLYRLS